MPNEQATFTTKILVSGGTDPSLLKTMGYTEKQMMQINKLTQALGTNAAISVKHYAKISPELQKAQIQADKLSGSMRRVSEIVAGVGIGEFLTKGLESAVDVAGELVGKMKEFTAESLKIRAEREVLQNQQKSMLESFGRGGQFAGMDMMLRNMEGRDVALNYAQLMSATNLLLSSAPKRFSDPEKMHTMLREIGDVSKNPATFDLATYALTRMLAGGKLDARHINEFAQDTGYNIRDPLAGVLHVAPSQLAAKIKTLTGDQGLDALMKALEVLTGPGGAAYGHASAQLKGLTGVFTQFTGHWEDFAESFGNQVENIIVPISQELFKYVTPAALLHSFDWMTTVTQNLGKAGKAIVDFTAHLPASQFSGVINKLSEVWKTIFGPKGLGQFFDYQPYGDLWSGNGGMGYVLSGSGQKGIKDILNSSTEILRGLADFATDPALKELATASIKTLPGVLKDLFKDLAEMIDLFNDLRTGNLGKFAGDFNKYEMSDWGKKRGGGVNMPGVSDYWPSGMPYMASGGVIVGEAGYEAVLPMTNSNLLDDLNSTLQQLNSFLTNAFPAGTPGGAGGSVGAAYGGLRGGGSGSMNTIYGPGVAGDQPGQRNYDWDSYHGIGHIHGVPFALGAGSVAIHSDYAEGVLHLKPGQWFTNPRNGKRQRWSDTSGSGNDQNIDEFVPAGTTYIKEINIHAIDSKSFGSTVKEHAKTIKKHIDNESSHQAKLNSKGCA